MRARCATLLLICAFGCGNERSIEAEFTWPNIDGVACIVGYGGGIPAYAGAFPVEEATGSLAFIEGDRVQGEFRLSARLRRGGRVLARAAATRVFLDPGASRVRLDVRRCHPRVAAPPTFDLGAVGGVVALAAADRDGDGRDEPYAHGAEVVRSLDGELLPGQVVRGTADIDGDCLDDLVVSGPLGLRAILADGSERAIDGTSLLFASGNAGLGDGVLVGGPSGAAWIDAMGRRALVSTPVNAVLAADLTGDGFDELLLGTAEGVDVFVGGEGGPTAVVGALPSDWSATALAVGDLDADGAIDVVAVDRGRLRVGRNRGDGLIESRPPPDVEVARIRVLDVDGDCADDVIAMRSGAGTFHRSSGDGRFASGVAMGELLDAVGADLDGDGVLELVVLRPDGRVETWSP